MNDTKGRYEMTIEISLDDQEYNLFKRYADMNDITVSDFARRAMLNCIEGKYDLRVYKMACAAYQLDPTTSTLDEVEKELMKTNATQLLMDELEKGLESGEKYCWISEEDANHLLM